MYNIGYGAQHAKGCLGIYSEVCDYSVHEGVAKLKNMHVVGYDPTINYEDAGYKSNQHPAPVFLFHLHIFQPQN